MTIYRFVALFPWRIVPLCLWSTAPICPKKAFRK